AHVHRGVLLRLSDILPRLCFSSTLPRPPRPTLFPYTTLFRSAQPQPFPRPLGDRGLVLAADHALERRHGGAARPRPHGGHAVHRSEEHTSELQSPDHLVCRLLLEKKKKQNNTTIKCATASISH